MCGPCFSLPVTWKISNDVVVITISEAKSHQYGLAQMFSVFLRTKGGQTGVFTSIDEADKWLAPAGGRRIGSGELA
jgi:hypothetical protein